MTDAPQPTTFSPEALSGRSLVLAAVEGAQVVADHQFEPGQTVTVGSNSGNGLILPERFELATYTLLTSPARLHLAPPFFVQGTFWLNGEAVALKGHVRDLRRRYPELAEQPVSLASERFRIHYATGLALVGRFLVSVESRST